MSDERCRCGHKKSSHGERRFRGRDARTILVERGCAVCRCKEFRDAEPKPVGNDAE